MLIEDLAYCYYCYIVRYHGVGILHGYVRVTLLLWKAISPRHHRMNVISSGIYYALINKLYRKIGVTNVLRVSQKKPQDSLQQILVELHDPCWV